MERKKTDLLIAAELEFLKLKKCISLDKDKINIIRNSNFYKSEKYILEHYKFINDKQFKINYLRSIESSLKDKGCITNYIFRQNSRIIVSFIIFFFSFFIGWFKIFNNDASALFIVIETVMFIIFGQQVLFQCYDLIKEAF